MTDTLKDIKQRAFSKWLLDQSEDYAVYHVYQCLAQGDSEMNHAWDLMGAVHGKDWRCKPEDMGEYIKQAINKLKEA